MYTTISVRLRIPPLLLLSSFSRSTKSVIVAFVSSCKFLIGENLKIFALSGCRMCGIRKTLLKGRASLQARVQVRVLSARETEHRSVKQ